jgi:hypothetical protein
MDSVCFYFPKFRHRKIGNRKELKKNSSIFLINNVIGAYDLVAFSFLRDLKDFAKTVDYFQQIPGVG